MKHFVICTEKDGTEGFVVNQERNYERPSKPITDYVFDSYEGAEKMARSLQVSFPNLTYTILGPVAEVKSETVQTVKRLT